MSEKKLNVVVWNEFRHEKLEEACRNIYPDGIHGLIKSFLEADDATLNVRLAALDDPDQGLPDDVLNETDVLLWWGHMAHHEVDDGLVERIRQRVYMGKMGLIVLHSGHHSKIFRKLMGTTGNLGWHDDTRERIFVTNPAHPIAQGLPLNFEIASEECYTEPFAIPEPQELVFIGWYNTGEVFRSGCCFHRGNGRIFYFQPGHETGNSFFVPEVRRIYRNAARWAAPVLRVDEVTCPWVAPLENVAE